MKREYSVSLIRTLALFMIIACHILQGLNNRLAFYVNVGVQIFFFISGYLYGMKKIEEPVKFYKKQFIKILQPFWVLFIIILLIDVIFGFPLIPSKLFLGNILGLGAFTGTHSVLSHTWFVTYILLCYLITPVLSRFIDVTDKKEFDIFKMIVSLFIIAFIFNFFGIVNFNMFWIVNYILGYIFSKYYIKNKIDYKKLLDLLIMILIIFLPIRIYIEFNLLNSSNFLILKFCDGYHVLLGSSIFVILYRIFSNYDLKEKTKKILDFFDKYSYFIYLVHQIFILNKYSCLFITDYLIVNVIIIILSSILSAICLFKLNKLIIKIFSKINWRNKNE